MEEYTAKSKMRYHKATDIETFLCTRNEDLVLDGLLDEHLWLEVKYHKRLEDIDEAVFHMVNMMQMRNGWDFDCRLRKSTCPTISRRRW